MWKCQPRIDVEATRVTFKKVPTYLDQPLWRTNLEPHKVTLLSLCSLLATYIHRELRNEQVEVFNELAAECKKINPSKSTKETLQSLELAPLFPEIMMCISSGSLLDDNQSDRAQPASFTLDQVGQAVMSTSFTGYTALMSYYNQVTHLADLLLTDTSQLQNHKYVAHQIVLLHQSVTKCQQPLEAFKREIEEHFDGIKTEIENFTDQQTLLSNRSTAWLQDMLGRLKRHTLQYYNTGNDGHIQLLQDFVNRVEVPAA